MPVNGLIESLFTALDEQQITEGVTPPEIPGGACTFD
jgi:hypothetical protein